MKEHWNVYSVPMTRCVILWWLFLCFAQNSVYTVCVSPIGFLFSVTEVSKTRGHMRKMIRCVDMS